jgi:DNA-binding protein H-NS
MKKDDLQFRSIEQLWTLHEEIASILAAKMEAEKFRLEKRLEQLKGKTSDNGLERRPYPKVYPSFQNPNPPHQAWSGRGKQPKRIREWLAEGKTVEDLRIPSRSSIAVRENN